MEQALTSFGTKSPGNRYSWLRSQAIAYPRVTIARGSRHGRVCSIVSKSIVGVVGSHLDPLPPPRNPATFFYRASLYEANSPISSVYLPIDGVAPLVNTMANGS